MNKTNECKAIHETTLKTLIDIWDSIQSIKNDENRGADGKFSFEKLLGNRNNTLRPGSYSSIAKAASNLTLVFPVICSRNISIENAAMVNKAIEKNAASMMQKLFASWQVSSDKVGSVQDYINQFHTNINSRAASLDDVFDLSSRMVGSKNESSINEKEIERLLREDMKNLDYYLPEDIKESSLSNYSVRNGIVSYSEAAVSKKVNGDANIEADFPGGTVSKVSKSVSDTNKTYADYFSKQILDGDYKKANELMPTSIVVNFQVRDNDGKMIDYNGGVVGIKAKLYPVSSEDIVKHVGEKVDDHKNWLVNFIRASTRETSFMKDFVLAIDKAKIDAMSLSDRRSSSDKMWKVLERRATNSRLKRSLNAGNSAAAITTLVLSQEEVEYMRKYNNVDIERIPNVLGLFESLSLMCLVIVDETLEVAKFIYDENDPMWETISFTHLERESNDNTYKRVVNLMTKVAR